MGHIQTHFVDDFCTFDLLKWEFHVYSVAKKRESKINQLERCQNVTWELWFTAWWPDWEKVRPVKFNLH